MNIERFHNELAMRLGYERIVKDKRISISVEESDDPCVILTVQGGDDEIRFNASDVSDLGIKNRSYLHDEITAIVDAVHHAYIDSINYTQGAYNQQLSQIRNVQIGELQFRYLPIKKMKVTNIQKKDSVITVTTNTLSVTEDKEKIKCDIRFCFINSLSEDEMVNKFFCDIARHIKKEE